MNKIELAQDPNTSPEVLEKLATVENYWVRSNVKQNPNCPEYIKTYCIARNFIERFYE